MQPPTGRPDIERVRYAFPCDDWEIRLLKRLRQLRAAGVDRVTLSLAHPTILAKIDARPEHLDAEHVPGLTATQTALE